MQQVLIISSDFVNCKKLKYILQDEKIAAYYTLSIEDGIRRFIRHGYQLVIIDITVPISELLNMMERIRKACFAPILVLSPYGDSDYIVKTFDIADDYIQKPFDLKICCARIHSLLRRCIYDDRKDAPGVLSKDGTLMIDGRGRKVYVLDAETVLPRKQYDLLYLLASNEGRVFTRDQLYRYVWGDEFIGGENVLNCQMGELRRRLKSISGGFDYIRTVYGTGYCFDTMQK